MLLALAVRSLSVLLQPLPLRAIFALGGALGRLLHDLLPWRYDVLHANLSAAGLAMRRLERAAYAHVARAALLAVRAPRQLPHVAADATQLAALASDCAAGGVLVCSAHIGFWELVPSALAEHVPARAKAHARIVYRPLHHVALDRWLRERRELLGGGAAMVPDDGSLETLRQALAAGGVVGVLPDQRPSADKPRLAVTMLGRPCHVAAGWCRLAIGSGCAVWFAALLHDDNAHHHHLELRLTRLSAAARDGAEAPSGGAAEAAARALAQAYADALDAAVAAAPAQYFWLHDRMRVRGEKGSAKPQSGTVRAYALMGVAAAVLLHHAIA